MNRLFILLSLFTLQCVCIVSGYYLPGVSPHTYQEVEPVKLFVSKLTSTKTQMPYDYYSLPYCKPSKLGLQSENIGEVVSGDRIENSVYKLEMKTSKTCEVACAVKLRKADQAAFIRAIDEEYRVHWIVDNLPVGMYATFENSHEISFVRGFPVGFHIGKKREVKHYLYNHIRIIVQYHDDADIIYGTEITSKIVGFRVEPMSIKHDYDGDSFVPGTTKLKTCNDLKEGDIDSKDYQSVDKLDTIIFTYDVVWEKSNTEWANRWDMYLTANQPNDKVHWFSITNSIMIVLFLTIMIAMILYRALRKDIAQYNEAAPTVMEEAREEVGWKMVHGDVFKPPKTNPILFCVFVGSGVQLGLMIIATLSFCLLGLLSPAYRGSLVTALIFIFVFMSSFAGYYSSKTYKMFRGIEWKQNTLITAFLYPGAIFSIFFVLNLALWVEGSSGAIPFSTFFTLLFLWFCVSVPLVFIGSFLGYKEEIPTFPVQNRNIERGIPPQAWYMSPVITCMLGGILPFGAVSVELFFIMSALWLHQIYYIFGFLFLVMIVLIITCAEVSILLCYFQLCNEDYHWWWRSFLTSGSCAAYMLLYSVWYNLTELDMSSFVPLMLYFGYMVAISFTAFLVTGTIGYFACFTFNYAIYSSIKVE